MKTAFLASEINDIDDFLDNKKFENINEKNIQQRDTSFDTNVYEVNEKTNKKRNFKNFNKNNKDINNASNAKKLKILNNSCEFKEPKPVKFGQKNNSSFSMKNSSFAQNSSFDSSNYSSKFENIMKNNAQKYPQSNDEIVFHKYSNN